MKIKAILEQKPTVSFEVFPPKQWDKIEGTKAVVKEMVKSHPAFMSVTYGAAGTTSGFTTEIAREILDDGVTPLAHLTCLTSTRDKIHQVVAELQENGIENMLNAIQAGVLTNSTKLRLEKLEAQQKELEIRIAEEKIARPRLSENQVRFWLTRFRKLDPNVKSHRETLINTFVNAVYLYDEKVLITFNYKDGTKTITFDEIAAKDAPEGNGSDLVNFAPPK